AIGGAVLTGFVLVPAIGVHASIAAGIATNLVLMAILLAAPFRAIPGWRWGAGGAGLAAAACAVLFLPPWNPQVMTSGAAIYAMEYLPDVRRGLVAPVLSGEILFYRDGPSA